MMLNVASCMLHSLWILIILPVDRLRPASRNWWVSSQAMSGMSWDDTPLAHPPKQQHYSHYVNGEVEKTCNWFFKSLGIPASAIGSCLFVIVVRSSKTKSSRAQTRLLINKSRYLSRTSSALALALRSVSDSPALMFSLAALSLTGRIE